MTDRKKNLAKHFRKNQTDAEQLLLTHLRMRQLENLKFRRQHQIGRYIVDFVCLERRLVVELDGVQHSVKQELDADRDAWLNSEGFKVLRFWNNQVVDNLTGVLEVIRQHCFNHPPLTPPLRGGVL
jgi:very-short-patch-repair endonuclease